MCNPAERTVSQLPRELASMRAIEALPLPTTTVSVMVSTSERCASSPVHPRISSSHHVQHVSFASNHRMFVALRPCDDPSNGGLAHCVGSTLAMEDVSSAHGPSVHVIRKAGKHYSRRWSPKRSPLFCRGGRRDVAGVGVGFARSAVEVKRCGLIASYRLVFRLPSSALGLGGYHAGCELQEKPKSELSSRILPPNNRL